MPDGSLGYYGGKTLDEQGRPVLGTGIFGNRTEYEEDQPVGESYNSAFGITFTLDKTLWGEPMEEDIEEQLGEPDMTETMEPRTESEVRSGISSVVSGMETPDIELQKRPKAAPIQPVQNTNYNPNDTVPKPLYQVLEPVQVSF